MALLEREGVWGKWEGERERERERESIGVLGRWGARADEWARGWDVAPRLCAHDMQRRCTSGPSASESRTVRE